MIARLRSSDIVRHGALVFGGVVVSNVFNYLYYMLAGRVVGVEGYGVVTSMVSAMLVLAAPATVAQLIVARVAADDASRGDGAALRALFDLVTSRTAVLGAAIVAAGIAARAPIATFFHLGDPLAIVAAAAALAFYGLTLVQRGVLQGAHRFSAFSVSMCVETSAKVLVGILLAFPFGAVGALWGLAGGIGLSVLYNTLAIRAAFPHGGGRVFVERATVWRMIAHVGVGQSTIIILSFYDVPLVKHVFDPTAAGLYAAAALVGRAVSSAVYFVPTLVMPKATARAQAGRSPLPLLGAAVAMWGAIAGVALICAAFAPRPIVTIIAGKAFGAAAPLVFVYVAAAAALSLANVVVSYKIGLHCYDFVAPVVVAAIAEIVTLGIWHPSALAVVATLAAGHLAVLAATLWRITSVAVPATAAEREAIAEAIAEEEQDVLPAPEPIA